MNWSIPPGRRAAAYSNGNGEKECKIVSLFALDSRASVKSSFVARHLKRSIIGLVVEARVWRVWRRDDGEVRNGEGDGERGRRPTPTEVVTDAISVSKEEWVRGRTIPNENEKLFVLSSVRVGKDEKVQAREIWRLGVERWGKRHAYYVVNIAVSLCLSTWFPQVPLVLFLWTCVTMAFGLPHVCWPLKSPKI